MNYFKSSFGVLFALSFSACGAQSAGGTDGSTHWLKACDKDIDCGRSLSCLCGVCTKTCKVNKEEECFALSEAAMCVSLKCEQESAQEVVACSMGCSDDVDCRGNTSCEQGVCQVTFQSQASCGDAGCNELSADGGMSPVSGGASHCDGGDCEAQQSDASSAGGTSSPDEPSPSDAGPSFEPTEQDAGVASEDGGGNIDSPDVPEPTPSADPASEPLWALLTTENQTYSVVNLNSSNRRFGDLNGPTMADSQLRPWSGDKQWIVDVKQDQIALYHAVSPALDLAFPDPGNAKALGWVGNDRVLLQVSSDGTDVLELLSLDGTTRQLAVDEPAPDAIASAGISPDGRWIVFTGWVDAHLMLYVYDVYQGDRAQGATAGGFYTFSEDVVNVSDLKWSPDGTWLALGVSDQTQNGGVYLTPPYFGITPLRVTPAGHDFSPLFSFSPQSNVIAEYSTGEDGSVLSLLPLIDSGSAFRRLAAASPAAWSPEGSFLLYSRTADEGVVQPMAQGEPVGEPLVLSGYQPGCALTWVADTQLIYEPCADAPGTLVFADLEQGLSASALELPDARLVGLAGPCLVVEQSDGLWVGLPGKAPELSPIPESASPDAVVQDIYGRAVAWSQGSTLGFNLLQDCSPQLANDSYQAQDPIQSIELSY